MHNIAAIVSRRLFARSHFPTDYHVNVNSHKSISPETRSARILRGEIALVLRECDLHGECQVCIKRVNLDLPAGISSKSHDHNTKYVVNAPVPR